MSTHRRICSVSLFFWLGLTFSAVCVEPTPSSNSVKSRPESNDIQRRSNAGQFPEVVVVQSEETKDRDAIHSKARALLTAKDYDALEKMAGDLRLSKAAYLDGYWKLWAFYKAFGEFSEKATDAGWGVRMDNLKEWVRKRTNSITSHVALAEALTVYAWRARGSGVSETVTETGWQLFAQRLAASHEVLKKSEKLSPCPHWYAVNQRIALGLGMPRQDYEKLYIEATKCEPTYGSFYFRKVAHLLPRWHGVEGEWEKFAQEAADQIGGEEGDILYAQIAWFVHDSRFYKDMIRESAINGNRAKRGYQLLLKRNQKSVTVASQFARLAVMSEDGYLVRALFEGLGGYVDKEIWGSAKYYTHIRNWAYRVKTSAAEENDQPISAGADETASKPPEPESAPKLKATPPDPLKLKGIFFGKTNHQALIGNQTVGVGEKVEGFEVIQIEPRRVTLRSASGETRILEIK